MTLRLFLFAATLTFGQTGHLSISKDLNGSRTSSAYIHLRGAVSDNVRSLEWENQDGLRGIAVEPRGAWTSMAPLALGLNEFVITASYADGSSKQARVSIYRDGQHAVPRDPAGEVLFQGRLVPFLDVDGDAVVEGDIIVGRVRDLLGSRKGAAEAVGVSAAGSRWTNNTVVYVWDQGLPEASKARVLQAMEFWKNNSPIQFVERTNQAAYQRIQRLTPDEGACFSAIGMGVSETQMRVADSCSVSTLIHELGHTIGLYHEQVRADRDRAITIDLGRIWADQASQVSPQTGNGADIGPYDFGSIMHYSQFSLGRNGLPSFFTIPRGLNVAEPATSAADLEGVRRLYGAASASGEYVVTTNPPGLQMAVDGATVTSPAKFNWAAGSSHTVSVPARQGSGDLRFQFGRWTNDGPRTQTLTANANDRLLIAHMVRQCRVPVGFPTPAEGGSFTVTPYSADGYYTCDSEVTLEAKPADGYTFARWNYTGLAGKNSRG